MLSEGSQSQKKYIAYDSFIVLEEAKLICAEKN